MKPITLPKQPPLAQDYELPDGTLVRALLRRVGTRDGHAEYESQAYVVDSDGHTVTDEHGWPIRTPGHPHTLNLSGVVALTARRDAGWVKAPPPVGQIHDAAAPPEGWATGRGAPTGEGAPGDRYLDLETSQGWQWSIGELEAYRRGRVEALQQILAERELDAADGMA